MPRFQLLVREPGKEPRCVPLADPMVVGRSRSVDLTVDDEEVGRKQFRIGVTSGFVVIEGLGATNPTRIESGLLKSGEKTTLPVGAQIWVGKTEFEVASADATEDRSAAPPDVLDRTMVAPSRPGAARPVPPPAVSSPAAPSPSPAVPPQAPTPAAEPMNTMEFRPPSMQRPGSPPPAAPAVGDNVGMNTMEVRPPGLGAGSAPGAGSPPAAKGPIIGSETSASGPPKSPPQPAPETSELGLTMAKGFRPGAANPAPPRPLAQPQTAPPPAAPPPAAPKPAAAAMPTPVLPARPGATPPAATPPAATPPAKAPVRAETPDRPKTVAVRPKDMPPPPSSLAASGTDLESRLHQSTPRLFVKGEGLKRPARLMKTSNKLGRAETADVLLPHESVSELHAEIRFDGENWSLLDCGSTNGSVVDGQLLRGTAQIIRRNSFIGIGALQLIFLCVNKQTAAQDRRDEDRALQLLAKSGRLDKSTANEIRQMVRTEVSQSIAEIVLRDTPLAPTDWANAIATARRSVSLLDRILRLFRGGK